MSPRTLRRHAEQAVAELEARVIARIEAGQPVPNALVERLKAARLHALAVGRRAK